MITIFNREYSEYNKKNKIINESELLDYRQRYGNSKHLQTKSSLQHYQMVASWNLDSFLLI